ncbi:MAG: putative toxin-antitoxin system toxin component, PIN family [Bacteroidaceae bacterium]|nr:putative toxin-antitoxin system toxin component, PIN family [Bacteroidaceae bacterium]
MIYAVIDTNVLVSALLTSNLKASTVKVIEAVIQGRIKPLYNSEIIDENKDVLFRLKFHFSPETVERYITNMVEVGVSMERSKSNEFFLTLRTWCSKRWRCLRTAPCW